MPPICQPKKMDLPIFCIVTDGGWEPWTGKDIETKGMGGSETWIIEMARHISETRKFHVVVFCKTNTPEFYGSVGYNPIEMFHEFITQTEVEHCVVSRYTQYIPVAIHSHVKNIYVVFHDLLLPELVIPIDPKIKKIFGLSQWHQNLIKKTFPQFEVDYINYGVDQELFSSKQKVKNKFIYSSFPNRGLVVLLKLWPKIIKMVPDATLDIYCNLEQEWVNTVAPEMMKEIKNLLKINKTGIHVHGWVSKSVLADAWKCAEYLFYPCIFEETFCLTAMEAAISKTFVISNNLAALSETIHQRGLIVNGNPLTQEWQEACISLLKGLTETFKQQKIEENYQWAKERSWKTQANLFLEKLKCW
jgi:glycosyltransferase involved in cell wall biosynthesis